ncbi:hypothetical protein ACOI1C_22380 [Bacillus sp. DJP31]|uniref:hypothetical protein n=1 Tax=Bacillus sp. DJP31 TaxID=3409789 RepID=UPI003BB5ADA2
MLNLIRKVFMIVVAAFLFFVFLKNAHFIEFLFINYFVYFLVLVIILAVIVWSSYKLDDLSSITRSKYPIQLFASLFIIFFLIFQLFTTYFYSEKFLRESGLEKIKMYYHLSNEKLDDTQRSKITEDALTELMAFSLLSLNRYPKEELIGIEIISLSRNYYQYDLVVNIESQNEKATYRFTFVRENGDFKIEGYSVLN